MAETTFKKGQRVQVRCEDIDYDDKGLMWGEVEAVTGISILVLFDGWADPKEFYSHQFGCFKIVG